MVLFTGLLRSKADGNAEVEGEDDERWWIKVISSSEEV